jgi:RNA polymerase sigma-70 factor (ECF subfamily)
MEFDARMDVTALLNEAARGEEKAKSDLFKLVYDKLRQMAQKRMRHERVGHTLGATGLVHEVYCHLMKGQNVFTKNRAYFFGAAARAMHDLLREYARRRNCRPEGHMDPEGKALLDELTQAVQHTFDVNLLELLDAIDRLKDTGKNGERLSQVVKLRIWGGFTYENIAEELGVGTATVERDWRAAQAWLRRRLKGREKR